MNYDLLIKLARLANNNPNDNEANLAARKVCKLIAEGNYKFEKWPIGATYQNPFTGPVTQRPQGTWEGFRPSSAQQAYQQQEARQQQEEANRQRGQERPAYYDFSFDFDIEKILEMLKNRNPDFYKQYTEGTWETPNYTKAPYNPFVGDRKPPRPKRKLKCSKCGDENETAFAGPPSLYLCYACQYRGK